MKLMVNTLRTFAADTRESRDALLAFRLSGVLVELNCNRHNL